MNAHYARLPQDSLGRTYNAYFLLNACNSYFEVSKNYKLLIILSSDICFLIVSTDLLNLSDVTLKVCTIMMIVIINI
jgi:hypothetical protein